MPCSIGLSTLSCWQGLSFFIPKLNQTGRLPRHVRYGFARDKRLFQRVLHCFFHNGIYRDHMRRRRRDGDALTETAERVIFDMTGS